MDDLTIVREGVTSPCGQYLYRLSRRWGTAPVLPFLLFNPSPSHILTDDRVIRRCTYFARREGCGGIVILNLYAYRTRCKEDLLRFIGQGGDGVGPENLKWVRETMRDEGRIILGWGGMTYKDQDRHGEVIRATFDVLPREITYWCLGATGNESPRHPSRVGNDVPLEDYWPGVEWVPKDSAAYRYITER